MRSTHALTAWPCRSRLPLSLSLSLSVYLTIYLLLLSLLPLSLSLSLSLLSFSLRSPLSVYVLLFLPPPSSLTEQQSKCVELSGHTAGVTQLCWSFTNANTLATCSEDKSVRVWDVRAGSASSTVSTAGENINITWSPNSNYIAVGNKVQLSPPPRTHPPLSHTHSHPHTITPPYTDANTSQALLALHANICICDNGNACPALGIVCA